MENGIAVRIIKAIDALTKATNRIADSIEKPQAEWISVADACALSGLSTPTITRAIRTDSFESRLVGARRLINKASFIAWIDSARRPQA